MPNFDYYMENNKKKLKEKIRKGIPDSLRGEVWLKISGVKKLREGQENLYNELISQINENDTEKVNDEEVIIKDMHRTFPRNILFKGKLGDGQRKLYRILTCFTMRNNKVGYVQGMSFLCAFLLSYETEEKAFWLLETIMRKYRLQELYYPGFPGLKKEFFVLLKYMKKLLPSIYNQFTRYKVYPTLYASSWYLTCFTNSLPFNTAVRILECYLFEGKKILLRFTLGILALKESEIASKKNFFGIMTIIKTITDNIDINELFKKSFGLSITRNKILKYENLYKDYISGKKTGDEEIMEQIKME